jgi:glycosyltransferase involved in cell wall biosynthesis
MTRVLRLTPHFYHPSLKEKGWPIAFDAIGGMQTQLFRQTLELGRQGIEQTVVTLRVPGVPATYSPGTLVNVRGVRVPILPIRSRIRGMVDLNASWFLGGLLETLIGDKRWDIIHVHGSGVFWPLLLGQILSRRRKIPLIVTVHCSILATYHAMSLFDRWLQPFAQAVERNTIRYASRTITLTNRVADFYISTLGVPESRVEVVPDCIDAHTFESLASEAASIRFRQRFQLPSNQKIIAFVGRIAHEKGWPHLLTLAQNLRDLPVHFLVCGDGNEGDDFRQRVRDLNLGSRFTITGFIPIEEVPSAMRCSDVLVLPSLHEEFGSVLLEAMAVRLPIVAFAVGGVPHVMPEGLGGLLVAPNDVESMADRVRRVLDDKLLACEIAEKGFRRVCERFDLSESCSHLRRMYSQVVGTK